MEMFIAVLQVIGTSALTTLLFGLLNSHFERRTKRKELLFTHAFQLAKERTELLKEVVNKNGGGINLRDNVFFAEEYYSWLEHLYDTGKLPDAAHDVESKSKSK